MAKKKQPTITVEEPPEKENKCFKKIYFTTSYERCHKITRRTDAWTSLYDPLPYEELDYTLTELEDPSIFAMLEKYSAQKKELKEAKKTILEMKAAIKKVNDFSGE